MGMVKNIMNSIISLSKFIEFDNMTHHTSHLNQYPTKQNILNQ
jgi:hypothetical protein